jgi:polyisoprenoid-binding protein YceI
MRRHVRSAALALFGLAPALVAWRSLATIEVQPESRLWVTGSSTVRGFTCKATAFDAKIESTSANSVAAILAGEKAVGGVAVRVSADKLDCANGTMNEHMLKALKAKEHGEIAFEVNSYELVKNGETVAVKLSGSLSMGGVTKPITLNADASAAPNGALHVVGAYELRMTEFGLKPPSLMFGTMKVDDRVKVGFDLLLKD